MNRDRLKIFTGNANPALAAKSAKRWAWSWRS